MNSGGKASSRCVLVLGMHRSGTSVLARALIALGVDFGSKLLVSRADNPKGFFEDKDTYELNEAFLGRIGCQWHSLRLPNAIPSTLVVPYENDIRQSILDKFADIPLWGLKEPRITRLLPHWLAALRGSKASPLLLLSNRHPFSVAASITRRDGLPEAQSLALWALHQLNGLDALVEHGGLVVDYDQLMASPRLAVERLATFLDISPGLRRTEVDHFIGEFLQADLRHAQFTEHSTATTPLQALCLDLYHQILNLAAMPGGMATGLPETVQKVMSETRTRLEGMGEWMDAVDALHSGHSARTEQIRAEHAKQKTDWDKEHEHLRKDLHKAQAQLEWLESRLPIRLYQQVKARLQKPPGSK